MKRSTATRSDNPKSGLDFRIPSLVSELETVCVRVDSLLTEHGLAHCSHTVMLLLREFSNNAIIHGNQCDPSKTVRIEVNIEPRWIVLTITDEGSGFDWKSHKCEEPPAETATSGRGLCIGLLYADQMSYNNQGNRVTLRIDRVRKEDRRS